MVALIMRQGRAVCNRYRMTAEAAELAARYGVASQPLIDPETLPPPELFPKRPAWIVRAEAGERVLDVMHWGFPPSKPGMSGVTNIRNLDRPFWRLLLADPARRCLVPVTDFCQYSDEKGSRTEHWFSVTGQPVFSFAGLWRPSEIGNVFGFVACGYAERDGDAETEARAAAAHVVGKVYPKAMPVILHAEDEERWLSGHNVASLARAFPSHLMSLV